MNEYQVDAQLRTDTGKAHMRRLRRTGVIPAVIYGAGEDPQHLALSTNMLTRQMDNEAFFSHILTINIEGKKTQAVLKALQRDPASARVMHADFLRVKATEEITMRVPLHFVNEEDSVGKREGGVISHLEVDVEISCLPGDLPEYIEVDLLEIGIGSTVHLSELTLPKGVSLTADLEDPEGDNDNSLVSVQLPAVYEEVEADEEVADEGEAADGDAADGETPDEES
jgi:large subunit ribosomal protein L25